jgi:anti-anti-sigma factor
MLPLPPSFSCVWFDGGEGAAWVKPLGQLDRAAAPDLAEAVRAAQASAPRVVLDLRGLRSLDRAAVQVIVNASRWAQRTAGRLVVVRGRPHVQRVLAATGAAEVVELVDVQPDPVAVRPLLEPLNDRPHPLFELGV